MQIIETDFEPDDLIAIASIVKRQNDLPNPDHIPMVYRIIVGESAEPHKKMPEVEKFCAELLFRFPETEFELYVGMPSDKTFPYPDYETETRFAKWTPACYQCAEDTILWMFKPPRELLSMGESRRGLMLDNITCMCYGSFNFRTLMTKETAHAMIDDLNVLMDSFASFYYFDSFTCVGENNAKHWNTPGIIQDSIKRWNKSILDKCKRDLETETDPEKIKRKQKIVTNVESGWETQFVLADPCVVLAPEVPNRKVRLESFFPYPVWVDDEKSTVYVYADTSDDAKNERRKGITKQLLDVEASMSSYPRPREV